MNPGKVGEKEASLPISLVRHEINGFHGPLQPVSSLPLTANSMEDYMESVIVLKRREAVVFYKHAFDGTLDFFKSAKHAQ